MNTLQIKERPPGTGRPPIGAPPPSHRRKKSGTKLIMLLILAVFVAGVAYIGWSTHAQPADGPEARRRMRMNESFPVAVAAAEKGDLNVYLNGLGTVTSLANVTVRTRISGQLTEIHFEEGQHVQQGDLLAMIDPRPYQVAVEQAEGQLQQAQAQLEQAQRDLARFDALAQENSIAKQQVDSQQALVNQFKGLVQSSQGAVDSAHLNLEYCRVTAPVSGRVGLRQVDLGNYVTPGDANGLVVLTQVQPISVLFTVPEDNMRRVSERLHAGIPLPVDAYDRTQSNKIATGSLGAIDNQADPATGTFKLRALFANADENLFPNQFVNVRMLLDVVRGATVIPTSAVERGQQGPFVYAVSPENVAEARPVTLGVTEGERVAVVQGLNVGDRVVTEGADRLRDASHVVVESADAGAGAASSAAPASRRETADENHDAAPSAGTSAPANRAAAGKHASPGGRAN